MRILVTGANGFVGRNLVESLKNIRDQKDRTRPGLSIDAIDCFDVNTGQEKLLEYCGRADFVFHLAGVNRPKDAKEFMEGNFGFSETLLKTLKKCHNCCPVMLASSIQACRMGRFAGSEYGSSKAAGEELFFRYAQETNAKVLVYRFPNLFGKWCRPNYNSVIATFCYNLAHDLPIQVNDRATRLELLYIDDLVCGLLDALEGKERYCVYDGDQPHILPALKEKGREALADGASGGELFTFDDADVRQVGKMQEKQHRFAYIPHTHQATLGMIAECLESFQRQPATLVIPQIAPDSLEKKLYSTYLSYLPKEKVAFPLKENVDERGSFTELLKTVSGGQFSLNVSKPGVTKGEHWHHSKWEFFIVVSGTALIRQRQLGTDPATGKEYEILEFFVDGEHPQAVHMLPGYTHSIVNLSDTRELVTLMWANEIFEPEKPDTYHEEVGKAP